MDDDARPSDVAIFVVVSVTIGLTLMGYAPAILGWIGHAIASAASTFWSEPVATTKAVGWWVGLAFLVFTGIVILSLFEDSESEPEPNPIIQFRDESPYGDANLADRESIQRAMQGHNNPAAPQFEE